MREHGKRLAIMQPYLFPYLGYFQLMHAVDRFVLLDDVAFINRGWINRNRILVDGHAHLFTVPLSNASQNTKIRDLRVAQDDRWKRKFLVTVRHAYGKAPYFEAVYPMVEAVVCQPSDAFVDWLRASLHTICQYLSIASDIVESSSSYENASLSGQVRILDICRREGAAQYVNAIGGTALYERSVFELAGVGLRFLRSQGVEYTQWGAAFVPGLSIIDVMMFNSPASIQAMLQQYRFM